MRCHKIIINPPQDAKIEMQINLMRIEQIYANRAIFANKFLKINFCKLFFYKSFSDNQFGKIAQFCNYTLTFLFKIFEFLAILYSQNSLKIPIEISRSGELGRSLQMNFVNCASLWKSTFCVLILVYAWVRKY